MKQEHLAKWLKIIITGVAVCIAIVYVYIIPHFGQEIIFRFPEYSQWYLPWLVFVSVTAIPIIIALVYCWQVALEIGRENSFSYINAKSLKRISRLAFVDSVYFIVGNILMLILNMNHPGILFLSLMVMFAGIAISVAAAALSHLINKAAEIREENELTI